MNSNNRIRLNVPAITLLLGLLGVFGFSTAMAHPPGLSSVEVVHHASDIDVRITFAVQDIEAFVPMDIDLDAEVSREERDYAKPKIASLIAEQFRLSIDGVEKSTDSPGMVSFDDQNNARVDLRFTATAGSNRLLQSRFLELLPEGHQQFVTVKDESGRTLAERMLNQGNNRLTWTLDATPNSSHTVSSFADFFVLGVEHIVTGYDHLLFLLGLLVVTHSVWPAIKIITFFTVAHSLTLALAGLNVFDLPPSFVEPFIAATIVYVAVENLLRGEHPKGRHWLTFGFGLIHGFGFASVLREMNIGSSDFGILLPLLSFNLGIESGQIVIAGLVLPLIWQLNNRPAIASKFLPACSAVIGLAGFYWLLERTLL